MITFSEITTEHLNYTSQITETLHPLPLFKKYLKYGYLPFFKICNEKEYLVKLFQIISTVVDTDLAYIEGYNAGTAYKIKKLLGVLSESVPFKPNIAALARKLDASRDSGVCPKTRRF